MYKLKDIDWLSFRIKKNKRKLLKASGFTHKPREQLRARGVSQMTILFQKPYIIKVTTKGERQLQNAHVVCGWPLCKYTSNQLESSMFWWKFFFSSKFWANRDGLSQKMSLRLSNFRVNSFIFSIFHQLLKVIYYNYVVGFHVSKKFENRSHQAISIS